MKNNYLEMIIIIAIVIIPLFIGILIYSISDIDDISTRLSISISAVAVTYGFIGFIGGIPTIRLWLTPKPELEIEEVKLIPQQNKNQKYHELLTVIKNSGKTMATNVIVKRAIIQKDMNKTVEDSSDRIEVIGMISPGTIRCKKFTISLIDISKSYDIDIQLQCDEGTKEEVRIPLKIER